MSAARRWVVAGVAVVVVGVVVAVALGRPTGEAASSGTTLPPATAPVTRATLTETEEVAGTLGYGDPTLVAGRLPGTVTTLPAVGSTVDRGQALYTVDNGPVPLLVGLLPLYRKLAPGVEGPDVRQFEENLAALGYQWFTVDDEYTSATATAVREWQEDLGLPETGTVELGRVVYGSGRVRVAEHKAHVGDPAAAPILTVTGTVRQVTVDLDVTKQTLVKVGAPTTVELPGGGRVAGTVAGVGTVATTGPAAQGGTAPTTIEVLVSVADADQPKLGTLDAAPVDVTLVSEERKDVLTVPVAALLALSEGGYGVQVVDGQQTRIVAVRTGLFADGRVEVSGDAVAEGMLVGVPT